MLKADKESKNTEAVPDLDLDRRRALMSMGRFAAYVAPAMTVLVPGNDAEAHHETGHTSNCQNFPNSPFCASAL